MCEVCGKEASAHTDEGVPLCAECYDDWQSMNEAEKE
jgi:hypothetical protein